MSTLQTVDATDQQEIRQLIASAMNCDYNNVGDWEVRQWIKKKRLTSDEMTLGLVNEILEARRQMSPATFRLLSIVKLKVMAKVDLVASERMKVEGIYACMCRQ